MARGGARALHIARRVCALSALHTALHSRAPATQGRARWNAKLHAARVAACLGAGRAPVVKRSRQRHCDRHAKTARGKRASSCHWQAGVERCHVYLMRCLVVAFCCVSFVASVPLPGIGGPRSASLAYRRAEVWHDRAFPHRFLPARRGLVSTLSMGKVFLRSPNPGGQGGGPELWGTTARYQLSAEL